MSKTQVTKAGVKAGVKAAAATAVVSKASKAPKQDRQRFYYVKTKGRFGMLAPKAANLETALELLGLQKTEVTESKELSTNRHGAIVEFCDIIDAIPEVKTAVSTKPVAVKAPEKVTVKSELEIPTTDSQLAK